MEKMKLIQSFVGLLCFFSPLLHPLVAHCVTPLPSRNQSPFVRVFGLPVAESGHLVSRGNCVGKVAVDIANTMIVSDEGREKILLDGETSITSISMRYGLYRRLEIGFDIPYVYHGGGSLDYFIEDWHEFFHLPNGHRDARPRKTLEFHYIRDGQTLHLQEHHSGGPGDVQFAVASPITGPWLKRGQNLALRATLKVPTGKDEELHGSGGVDFSLRFCGEDNTTLSAFNLEYWAMAGLLYMGKGDVLSVHQREIAAFGTLGLAWQLFPWLDLKVQVDGHTAMFHSELTELGIGAILLGIGGTAYLPADYYLDFNVVEDLAVDTAADVVFQFALRKKF